MSKRRQWQVEATLKNGAQVTFGIGARSEPAALLRAYQALAEFPCGADHLTLRRIYWRGIRFARRQEALRAAPCGRPAWTPDQLLGARHDTPDQTGKVVDFDLLDVAPPSDGDAPSAALPPSRA